MKSARRRTIRIMAVAAMSGWIAVPAAPAGTETVKVVTEKADATYAIGEKVKFLVTYLEDDKPVAGEHLTYTLAGDGMKEQKGTMVSKLEPVDVEASLDHPGFILGRMNAPGKIPYPALTGAAVAPLQIKAVRPPPADFDAFWQNQLDELARVPLKPVLVPVDPPATFKNAIICHDVKVDCLGDAPVRGYLAKPKNAAPKSLPAIVLYESAGVHTAGIPATWAYTFATNGRRMLALDINAHGIENGQPKEYYDALASGRLKGYAYLGADDRKKCYFLGMFLRVKRALDFIKDQPEWDGRTLIVLGPSQGGGQAIVAAALDSQVTFCAAMVPALCNHTGSLDQQGCGWPGLLQNTRKNGQNNPDVIKTAPYFDAVYFAPKVKAQTVVQVGFLDETAVPTAQYAMYNNLTCKKEIVNSITAGHGIPPEAISTVYGMVDAHVRAMKTQK